MKGKYSLTSLYHITLHLLQVNLVFMFMNFLDILFSSALLLYPQLTCEGNSYLRCLPFLLNNYLANILVIHIKFPYLYESDRPDRRIPFIAVFNIVTLILYGGLACPLNLGWTETFKPFSSVILVNRKTRKGSIVSNNSKNE